MTGTLFDDRLYYITGPNGLREGNMTRAMGDKRVAALLGQLRTAGWSGIIRLHYRDGSVVTTHKVGDP